MIASIPSPASSGVELGPFDIHMYGLMYAFAVTAAVLIVRRRWSKLGGDPELPFQVAIWAFPAGLLGGRLYFDITSFNEMPHTWWGPFAVWDGGLGIWGGIALGAAAGIWYLHRHLAWPDVYRFINAATPGLLVAQAIGRIGNYFNQELFGKPSTLPWALKISAAHRPAGYAQYATYQPTFLYEIIWNLLLAATLVWLDNRRKVRPPALFALYVAGYSAFRIFEETLRIDYSEYILGMRLNFWVALIGTVGGLLWFAKVQFKRPAGGSAEPPDPSSFQYSRSGTV